MERPLRLKSRLTLKAIEPLRFNSGDEEIRAALYEEFGDELFTTFGKLAARLDARLAEWGSDDDDGDDEDGGSAKKGLTEKKRKKLLNPKTWERDGRLVEAALALRAVLGETVYTDHNAFRDAVDAALDKADPLYGKGEGVEYEPDGDLRDTEQVPLLEEGGIEAFIRREVLPYTPDAWIKEDATKIGYEVSFTRHFYKPQPLR